MDSHLEMDYEDRQSQSFTSDPDEPEDDLDEDEDEDYDPPDSANPYARSEGIYPRDQSPTYRRDMKDAGRGHLLR